MIEAYIAIGIGAFILFIIAILWDKKASHSPKPTQKSS